MSQTYWPENEPGMGLPAVPAGEGFYWDPITEMSDEFCSGELHPKWIPFNKNWKGRKPGFFRKENTEVTDHRLKLWSREEQPPPLLRAAGYKDFSTSFIRTKHLQKYGYFETYCKMMDSNISSAFWFANNEPRSWWTEIDVFEYSTSTKGRKWASWFNTNLHMHRHGEDKTMAPVRRPQFFDMEIDLSKEPHKYAMDWTKEYVAFYFDDLLVRKVENTYWHRPMHLQFDSETFPNWFGLPETGGSDRNKLPNCFEIYYVRSWRRSPISSQ